MASKEFIRKLPLVFLEAHNIQNLNKGLGVFNFELLKALTVVNTEFQLMANMPDKSLMKHFDSPLMLFHRYNSLQRKPWFRIRKNANIWHSLNQNTKVEPFHDLNYVLTIHDLMSIEVTGQSEGKSRLEEKIKRARAITYISDFVRKETHRFFDIPAETSEYVIYNGNPITQELDTSQFRPVEAAKLPFLYAIGDFQERKNFHSLIEMMRVNKEFNLVISGQRKSHYAQNIQTLIDKHGLGNRVVLTGVVSEMGKQYYMKNAAAFMFPSTGEGFGLPIIEAMKFGKPVFLSTLTCLPEIGGKDAYYFENFDPEQMNEKLAEGLAHFSENKIEMELKMRQRALLFSWENAARKYMEVYRALLV